MVAICNESFLRDLKLMDKRLGVKFNGSHFVITYDRGSGNTVNLIRIKDEDGKFRQPDMRDLKMLYDGDRSRFTAEEHFQRVAYYMDHARKLDAEKRKEFIREITKDNKIQLRQHFERVERGGKANSAFRIRSMPKESPPEKLIIDLGSALKPPKIIQAGE